MSWQACILRQLNQRNAATKALEEFMNRETELQENDKKIKLENLELNQMNSTLKSILSDMEEKIRTAATPPRDDGALKQLQNEISECYKQLSDRSRQCLELSTSVASSEEKIKVLIAEKEHLFGCLREKEDDIDKLQLRLDGKEKDVGLIKEELLGNQEALVNAEEKISQLKKELKEAKSLADKLENKLMDKVSQDVEHMNAMLKQQTHEIEIPRPALIPVKPLPPSIQTPITTSFYSVKGLQNFNIPSYGSTPVPKTQRRHFQVHHGEVNCIAYSPSSGNLIVSGGSEKAVKVWDSYGFQTKASLLGSDDSVLSVNFSPNEELVLATCSSRSSWVWPIGSTKQDMRRCLTGHQSKVTCGQFTPNGDKAITGSHDRTLKIWDLQNRVCLKTFSATSAVHDLSVSRDGSFVVSGHQDCTVRFWDMRSGQMLADLSKIHSKLITGVSISPDGTKVLSLSRDFSLKIINSFTHEVELTIKHPKYRNAPKARGCWSPDGRLVAAGSEEGETFIWDGATGKCEATLKGDNPNPISQVTWNPSGIHLASADRAGYITLWG